jgi:hypothetical protein
MRIMTLNCALGQYMNLCARNAWLWSQYSRQWSVWYDGLALACYGL